jgi:large subunit ribosomal protein L10
MTATKTEVVSQLTESLKGASGVYLADFTGLTVEKVTVLRSDLRKKGVAMRVAKNTLIQRALANVGVTGLDKYLTGPTAMILADAEDPMAPAKLLVEFLKKNENAIKTKAIHIDGQISEGAQLVSLSKMPGKRELQAQVITLAMSPGATLLALFRGPGSAIASQIQSLVSKVEAGESVQKVGNQG